MASAYFRRDRGAVYYSIKSPSGRWLCVRAIESTQALAARSLSMAIAKAKLDASMLEDMAGRLSRDPGHNEARAALVAHGVNVNAIACEPTAANAAPGSMRAVLNEWRTTGRPDLAPKTRYWYTRALTMYADWLDANTKQGAGAPLALALAPDTLQAYQQHRLTAIPAHHGATHGKRALLTDMQSLSAFEAWAVSRRILDKRTVGAILKAPTIPQRARDLPSPKQVRALLEVARKFRPQRIKTRNPRWLWIELAIEAGLRKSEIQHLRWGDLALEDANEAVLTVRPKPDVNWATKSNRTRQIPLLPHFAECLTAYRETLPKALQGDGVWIFNPGLHRPSKRPATSPRDLKRIFELAGVPWDGLHALRVLACVRWFRAGITHAAVRRLMGHSSLTTTIKIYADHVEGDNMLQDVRAKLQENQ